MALTIGEAQAVNHVVRRLLNGAIIDDLVLDKDTRQGMCLLADKAFRALHAGLSSVEVVAALAQVDRARDGR